MVIVWRMNVLLLLVCAGTYSFCSELEYCKIASCFRCFWFKAVISVVLLVKYMNAETQYKGFSVSNNWEFLLFLKCRCLTEQGILTDVVVIHIITRVTEVFVLVTYNWVDSKSEKTVGWGFAAAETSWLSWCQFEDFFPFHWCFVVQELKKKNIMCIPKLCGQQLLAHSWNHIAYHRTAQTLNLGISSSICH